MRQKMTETAKKAVYVIALASRLLTSQERESLGLEIYEEARSEIFEIDSIVHLCLTGKPLSQVMEEEVLAEGWLDY
jgi:hypothetical protein